MANTVISLKKSGTPSAIPVDLANGELAINYADGKIFYKSAAGSIQEISGGGTGGNSFGTVNANGTLIVSDTSGDVFSLVPGDGIAIVGDAINDTITISATAVSGGPAYDKANSANIVASAAYDQANLATTIGSSAFDQSNTNSTTITASFGKANDAYTVATSSFDKANLATTIGSSAFDYANNVGIIAIAAYDKANAANLLAYNTGIGANAYADVVGTSANLYADLVGISANDFANQSISSSANIILDFVVSTISGANAAVGAGANTVGSAAFDKANTAETIAIAAYANANSKLSSSGGTITGDLAVVGNLAVSGNTSYISVQNYRVDDPLVYLAGNNYVSDIVDIGFIGNYVNSTGSNVHTGLFREHTNKEYYLFYGYDQEPRNNHIDPNGNNFTIAVLNADLKTSNLVLGGQNAITWVTSAYEKANSSVQSGYVTIAANGTNIVADSNNDTLILTASQNVAVVGNATTDEVTFDLTNTGVVASVYGSANVIPVIVVDEKGRIVSVSNVAIAVSGGSGGGFYQGNNGDIGTSNFGDIFRSHANTLTSNVTVSTGNNSIAAGPIIIADNASLTIEDGARVSIV